MNFEFWIQKIISLYPNSLFVLLNYYYHYCVSIMIIPSFAFQFQIFFTPMSSSQYHIIFYSWHHVSKHVSWTDVFNPKKKKWMNEPMKICIIIIIVMLIENFYRKSQKNPIWMIWLYLTWIPIYIFRCFILSSSISCDIQNVFGIFAVSMLQHHISVNSLWCLCTWWDWSWHTQIIGWVNNKI